MPSYSRIKTITLDTIDIQAAIANAETQLKKDQQTSLAMKSAMSLLLLVVKLLLARLGMNSRNSSKPPANDPNRERPSSRVSGARPVGGQPGRIGTTLTLVKNPDHIQVIQIDRKTLPPGLYHDAGFERRQIIDLQITRVVTEYRAQMLVNENGQKFVAEFPPGVTRPAQYGTSVKANAVYMSMFQLIPYERVQTHFDEQFDIPISTGTLSHFNSDA